MMDYLIYDINYKIPIHESILGVVYMNEFDENIDDVKYPDKLQKITFGFCFNQRIDKIVFPESLKELTFGVHFNRNIDKVKFPKNLQTLVFGEWFDKNIDNVVFPDSLQSITFGEYFYQNIDKVNFPKSLKSITFINYHNNQINIYLEIDELRIKNLDEPIANLPLTINKIILLNVYDKDYNERREQILAKSKIPFGCQILYEYELI